MTALEWDHASERDVVERAKIAPEAFASLYNFYFGRIYSYAYFRTRSLHEAEDVTAETFRRAFEHIGSYQHRGVAFSSWLYRIASNVAIDGHRRRVPQVGLEEASGVRSSEPVPEEIALRSERARELKEAVAALPDSQRQVVVLRFFQGLRNKEIAEAMGRSEGAVKLLLFRALRNLRDFDTVDMAHSTTRAGSHRFR